MEIHLQIPSKCLGFANIFSFSSRPFNLYHDLGDSVRQFGAAVPRREPGRRAVHRRRPPLRHHGEEGLRPEGAGAGAAHRGTPDHLRVGHGAEPQEVRIAGRPGAVAQAPHAEHRVPGSHVDNEHVRRGRTAALPRLYSVRQRFDQIEQVRKVRQVGRLGFRSKRSNCVAQSLLCRCSFLKTLRRSPFT